MLLFIAIGFFLFAALVRFKTSRVNIILGSTTADTPQARKAAQDLDRFSRFMVISAVIMILISFMAPYLFSRQWILNWLNVKDAKDIGDSISSLANPLVALAGVIVTGLAFYMQYKANNLQRELFFSGQNASTSQFQTQLAFQQFESQFYEMLRLHKENVNEMQLPGKRMVNDQWEPVTVSKRAVFQQMFLELETLLEYASYDNSIPLTEIDNEEKKAGKPLTANRFKACYHIFFWGFDEFQKYDLPTDMIQDLKNIQHDRYPGSVEYETLLINGLKFVIDAFRGHSSDLGHYFRHLFTLVKFVVNSPVLKTYNDRMRYLKILRAQLSNYEQIMLFYNWVSDYGGRWEDKDHQYFTEYVMIHNLWYNQLSDNKFIRKKVKELKKIPVKDRQGPMFEIDDN
jgi:hypothetical protein